MGGSLAAVMARPGTEKFLENPLEFARTHPVIAEAEPIVFNSGVMAERVKWTESTRDRAGMARHTLAAREQALCIARIDKVTSKLSPWYGGYRVDMDPYIAGTEVRPGWFTCWYLPWNSAGGQVDMKIPDDIIVNHLGQDVRPKYFFTAALSGCSVFIRGRHANSPQVFHSGGVNKSWVGNSADHWRTLYKAHRPNSKNYCEVNFQDYVGPTMPEGDEVARTLSTARIENYINTILGPQIMHDTVCGRDVVKLQGALGMGCVFGIRQDLTNDWIFYLQENVQIVYWRMSHNTKNNRYVNRTMQVKQIWPQGGPQALINLAPKALP